MSGIVLSPTVALPALPLQSGSAVTTDPVVVGPLLVALVTAVLALVVPGTRARQGVSVAGVLAYAVAVGVLVARVLAPLSPGQRLVYELSNWPAPVGIVAVADALSVFMLAVAAVVAVPTLVYSVLHMDEEAQALTFHPLFHFMLVGVSGSFLTGDLFNLFVWFEVMLMSSYVLVVYYSGPEHTRAGLQYVVLNLVGSALMLVAIGGLYASTGTLNLADMARRLAAPAEYGVAVAPVLGLSAILFGVFALKAGLVPFQFWVPSAYGAAPAPVAAMLAGVVKKVGVYVIVRLYFTVFAAAEVDGLALPLFSGDSLLAFYGPVLLVVSAASIVLGGIGAVSRDSFDDVLSYSSIGQVGFIVLPLALAATAAGGAVGGPFADVATLGVAATLVYTVSHALAKAALFLASGTIESATGTDSLSELGGLAKHSPPFSAAVFLAGIALVGIPPVVGFFGKFLVFSTALRAGSVVALAAALGGAVLTIAYFTRAWNRGFWGATGDAVGEPLPRGEVAVVVAFGVALLAVGIGFDPVVRAAEVAAEAALDTTGYVDGVAPVGDGSVPAETTAPDVDAGLADGVSEVGTGDDATVTAAEANTGEVKR